MYSLVCSCVYNVSYVCNSASRYSLESRWSILKIDRPKPTYLLTISSFNCLLAPQPVRFGVQSRKLSNVSHSLDG
jgi:hypothetical protein